MKKKLTFILAFTGIFHLTCFSQAPDSTTVHLREVEVNAVRNKLYTGSGRILSVLDKADIEHLAVQTIDQLLDYVSGLDIRQRGAGGTQADISIRGGSFDEVLVLLNGVNITDPQTGHYNLDIPLNLSDVTRVEVLEGSAARVLGPNAFSGAINIITDKEERKSLKAEVAYGSYNTMNQSFAGRYGSDWWHNFLSVSHDSSKGYMVNTDYDMGNAYLQSVWSTKIAGKFSAQVAAQYKGYGANSFYTPLFPNQYDATKTFLGSLDWNYTKNLLTWNAQIAWREHHDRFELFRGMVDAPSWYSGYNYHLTDVTEGKISASYAWKTGRSVLALDVRNEHILSNALGNLMPAPIPVPFESGKFFTNEGNRLITNILTDHSFSTGSWYFAAGVAGTYSSSFGFNSYGGVDLAYLINENLRLFADANSAVRLPTFTDLYYQAATQRGNPALKPEKSQTIEAGIKWHKESWNISGSVFRRFGQNVIDWIKYPDSTVWVSRNLTQVNASGANATVEYSFQSPLLQHISLSYSYLTMDKSATGFESKYALDYLRNKFLATLQHRIWKNFSASWDFSYNDRAGQYSDFSSGQLTNYKPYFLLDGRLLWEQKHWTIFIDGDNLLNQHYADYGGLIQPGFHFRGGIKLKIN